jgi:hypothetical protein
MVSYDSCAIWVQTKCVVLNLKIKVIKLNFSQYFKLVLIVYYQSHTMLPASGLGCVGRGSGLVARKVITQTHMRG